MTASTATTTPAERVTRIPTRVSGPHTHSLQAPRELIRPRVELAIRELFVATPHRGGIRGQLRMFLEQVMETAIAAIRRRRLIPRRQQLVPFGVGQQRQVGERGLGCGHDRFQQGPEMAGHPCDAGLIEQVGVVLPRRREPRPDSDT